MAHCKADLINRVASNTGLTKKDVKDVLDNAFAEITNMAYTAPVQIFNFGVFKMKTRAQRAGRNPRTGAVITIPESTKLGFSVTKAGQ